MKIIKDNKSTINNAIYIKVFSDGGSYISVSTDDVLKNTNNKTSFTKLKRVFEENFEMKAQEGSVLNYLNFRNFQSPLGFSVEHTDRITEIVNACSPTGKFIRVDKPFRKDYAYEKELMDALPLTGNDHHKAEMEYHGKFGHNIGRIQHIAVMGRIEIFYATFHLATQTMAPTIPGFQ